MGVAEIQTAAAVAALLTRELILAAALLIAIIGIDDLIVDAIYFTRRIWRSATIYRRYPRINAAMLPPPRRPGAMATPIPAWDEAAVIRDMLNGDRTSTRLNYSHYCAYRMPSAACKNNTTYVRKTSLTI